MIASEESLRKREAEEARITATQAVQEAEIFSKQAVEEREIEAKRRIEESDISRQRSVDVSGQEAAIIVANKSEEKSQAEAEAAKARANFVKEEEQVVTVRETAVANRRKEIEIIKARETAEQQAIEITVAADADKKAAADKAEAFLTEAKAAADKIRITAEADEKRLEVEAFGEKAINEAKNLLSSELISFELRKILAGVAPQIMEASVKPMEKIESIKILQANGFGGGATGGGSSAGAGGTGSGGGLPNQLVDAALGYRMNLPLVDKMLEELGLDPSSAEGLSALLKGKTETIVLDEDTAGKKGKSSGK